MKINNYDATIAHYNY